METTGHYRKLPLGKVVAYVPQLQEMTWSSLAVRAKFWADISPKADPSSHFPQSFLISTSVGNIYKQAWHEVHSSPASALMEKGYIKSECFLRLTNTENKLAVARGEENGGIGEKGEGE